MNAPTADSSPAAGAATPPVLGCAREVTGADLPFACPPPDAPLWSAHPRVYLDVLQHEEVACPYCGARYRFSGERPRGHH